MDRLNFLTLRSLERQAAALFGFSGRCSRVPAWALRLRPTTPTLPSISVAKVRPFKAPPPSPLPLFAASVVVSHAKPGGDL